MHAGLHLTTALHVARIACGQSGLRDSLNDPYVPFGRAVDHAAGCLVRGTLECLGGLLHALELDDHGAHVLSPLVSLRRQTSAKETAAATLDRGSGKFRVFGDRVRVRYRSVKAN